MSLSDQQWCPTSVQVTAVQARGLRIKGKSGTNDAYALMQVGKEKFQTSVAEKSVAPVWREEAAFDLPTPLQAGGGGGGGGGGGKDRSTLHVHVLHRALVGPDKLLGQAVINLLQLSEDRARTKTEWFKLLDKTGKPDKDRGEVLLDIQFMRNNMTASMFDLSAAGKSRSRLGKLKDKVRGKKKESDSSPGATQPFAQVLTDSEDEANGDDGEEAAAPNGDGKNKKHKMKSLFSSKSNLQKSLSQSMSVLPAKNSTLSGSQSSGLNVESSQGKKKFKFKIHKRSGSSDLKESLRGAQKQAPVEQSNLCINGSHIYCEEPPARTSRIGSNFSQTSSGHGSMEDVPENSPPSIESLSTGRQCSPWTEEDEEEPAEEGNVMDDGDGSKRDEEEEKSRLEEERRRKIEEEEEARKQEELERLAEEERKQEEERQRIEEEKCRLEEEEHARREEEEARREEEERARREEERVRREEEERARREEEERVRREKEERARREEEEARREEEERARREEEERARREEERVRREKEEHARREEEEARREEEERARREEERVRREKEEEKARKEEEAERARRKEEEERARREEEEERARREEEEHHRLEEERKMMEQERLKREEECLRLEEKRRLEEEKLQREEEERVRREEEERVRRELEEAQTVKRQQEELEKLAEEKRKQEEEEEEERAQEVKRQLAEEKRRILEEDERKRREEEELVKRQEQERRQEEEMRIRKEEERKREEAERMKKEKEDYERLMEEEKKLEEERRRVEAEEKFKEEERMRLEEEQKRKEEEEERKRVEQEKRQREEEERIKKEEEEERARKEKEEHERLLEQTRQEEEKRRMEEEERMRREEEERLRVEEDNRRKREEEERMRKEAEEKKRLEEEKKRLKEEERRQIEEEKVRKEKEERAAQERKERLAREEAEKKKKEQNTKAAGKKSKVIVPAGGASTNPFDEDFSTNPFEETPSSAIEEATPLQSSSCRSAAASVANKTLSAEEKDVTGSHREKRPAPQPPGRNQAEKPSWREQEEVSAPHLARANKQSPDKDVRTVSVPPQRSTLVISPQSRSPTDSKDAQNAKPAKRPAPSRPEEGRTAAPSQGRVPPGSQTKPVVYGLNPFEDDDDEVDLEARDDPAASGHGPALRPPSVSQTDNDAAKTKSSKVARAPPPPAQSDATPSASNSQNTDRGLGTDGMGERPPDTAADQTPTEATRPVRVEETPLKEDMQSSKEAGVKKQGPPVAVRRLQPVKPLSPVEQPPVSVVQGENDNKSAEILGGLQDKSKVDAGTKGPYSQLTREELISLVLKQEQQLSERDKKISELETYIDNLLVRVMEEQPSILMSLNAVKKPA